MAYRVLPKLLAWGLAWAPIRASSQEASCASEGPARAEGSALLQKVASSMKMKVVLDGQARSNHSNEEQLPGVPPPQHQFMIAMEQNRAAYEEFARQRKADKIARGASGHKLAHASAPGTTGHGGVWSTDVADLPFDLPFSTDGLEHGPMIVSLAAEGTAAVIYWSTMDEDNIKIAVAANAQFFAFGMNLFGPTLPGADVVICGMHDSEVKFVDYKGVDYSEVEVDVNQDWTTTSGGRVEATLPDAFPSWICLAPGSGLLPGNIAYTAAAQGVEVSCASAHSQTNILEWVSADRLESMCCTEMHARAECAEMCEHAWQLVPDQETPWGTCRELQTYYRIGMGGACPSWAKWVGKNKGCCDTSRAAPVIEATTPVGGTLVPVTYCQGTRLRKTCHDEEEDFEIEDPTMRFDSYWVWPGPDFAIDNPIMGMAWFAWTRRHSMSFSWEDYPQPTDEDQMEFELVAPTITVGDGGTLVCSYHKLPPANIETTKYHIVEFNFEQSGPAQEAGIQHHVGLLSCSQPLDFEDGAALANCYEGGVMEHCATNIFNQGRAGRPMPMNVGKAVGGPGGVTHVVFVRHFYNTDHLQDVQDINTKFTVTYTDALRPKDELQLMISRGGFTIPANTLGTTSASCPNGCMSFSGGAPALAQGASRRLDASITGVAFHMHNAAKSAMLRAYDETAELHPIAHISAWIPGSPGTVAVKREVGSNDLKLDCSYEADYEVSEGPAASQEMCVAILTIEVTESADNSGAICYQSEDQAAAKQAWCPPETVDVDLDGRTPFDYAAGC